MMDTAEYEDIRIEQSYRTNDPLKGADSDERPVAFRGRHLAQHSNAGRDDTRGTEWDAYESEDGQYVIETYAWSRWQGEGSRRSVEIFADLDALRAAAADDLRDSYIPESLVIRVEEALGLDPAIRIDATGAARFPALVSVRVPEEISSAIDAVAGRDKVDRSDVVRAALEAFEPIRHALQQ